MPPKSQIPVANVLEKNPQIVVFCKKYQTYIFMELHKIIEDNRSMMGGEKDDEEDFESLIGATD